MSDTRHQWVYRFVKRLEDLVGDRGAMAELRRGHGQQPPLEAYRYLPSGLKPREEDAALLVAQLFARWHQGKDSSPSSEGNLGASFRQLAERMKRDANMKEWPESVERRFVALLNRHRDDLHHHLRQAVSLLKSREVAIDWSRLLRDILYWSREDGFVQKNWARAFWTGREDDEDPEDENVDTHASQAGA